MFKKCLAVSFHSISFRSSCFWSETDDPYMTQENNPLWQRGFASLGAKLRHEKHVREPALGIPSDVYPLFAILKSAKLVSSKMHTPLHCSGKNGIISSASPANKTQTLHQPRRMPFMYLKNLQKRFGDALILGVVAYSKTDLLGGNFHHNHLHRVGGQDEKLVTDTQPVAITSRQVRMKSKNSRRVSYRGLSVNVIYIECNPIKLNPE